MKKLKKILIITILIFFTLIVASLNPVYARQKDAKPSDALSDVSVGRFKYMFYYNFYGSYANMWCGRGRKLYA